MGKTLKVIAAAIGTLVLLVIVLIGTAFFIDWGRFTGFAETTAGGILGREVKIGRLSADVGLTTEVTLRDVRIANPNDMDGQFSEVRVARLAFKPLSILSGHRVITEIVLDKPKISAVRQRNGRANWDFAPQGEVAGEAVEPDDRYELPEIRRLEIKDGRMTYRDVGRGLSLEGTIATVLGKGADSGGVVLKMEGKLEDFPTRVEFSGGPLYQLRETDEPYPLDLSLIVGETKVRAEGTVREPVKLRGVNIQLSLRGPSLAHVFPIFLIPMPHTPPYRLEGRLERREGKWGLRDFSGKVGESDLQGSIVVDYGSDRPRFRGDLVSQRLDVADLGGLIGGVKRRPENDSVLPSTPIDRKLFKAADLDIRFRGKQLVGPTVPGMSLDMRVRLDDGVAYVKPLKVSLPLGRVAGEVRVDATRSPPEGKAALFIDRVDFRSLLEETRFSKQSRGQISGRVEIEGNGDSFASMLRHGNGKFSVVNGGGTLSALLVEALGLDVAESLALLATGDAPVKIRCGRIEGRLNDGIVGLRRTVVDTADTLLTASGTVDLRRETLDLNVRGHSKDFSLVDLSAPVVLRGPFKGPRVRIGGIDLLPFLELGDTKNIDCTALMRPAP